MPVILTTPFADDDLVDIWRYIAKREKDIEPADAMYNRIVDQFERLASHPLIGQLRGDLGPGIRTSVLGNYIIIYSPLSEGIEVFRVVHGGTRYPQNLRALTCVPLSAVQNAASIAGMLATECLVIEKPEPKSAAAGGGGGGMGGKPPPAFGHLPLKRGGYGPSASIDTRSPRMHGCVRGLFGGCGIMGAEADKHECCTE